MKILILALFSFSVFAQTARMGMISKTVSLSQTAERLSASDLLVKKVILSNAGTYSGLSYIGATQGAATASQGYVLSTSTAAVHGKTLELGTTENSSGPKINLKDIWVGVAANGGIVNAIYIE